MNKLKITTQIFFLYDVRYTDIQTAFKKPLLKKICIEISEVVPKLIFNNSLEIVPKLLISNFTNTLYINHTCVWMIICAPAWYKITYFYLIIVIVHLV